MNEVRTDFLNATPTFLTGAATVFALSGFSPSFNTSPTETEADSRVLYTDWSIVGQDISMSLSKIEETNLESKNVK